MSPLRLRMLEYMQLKHYSPSTIKNYLSQVSHLPGIWAKARIWVRWKMLPLICCTGALSLQLGYTKGTTMTRSFFFEVDVQPHSNSEYNIVWKEVWQEGEVLIQNTAGATQNIPFEIKSEIRYEIASVKVLKCN